MRATTSENELIETYSNRICYLNLKVKDTDAAINDDIVFIDVMLTV